MLVVTRKLGESIVIGNGITVTVVEVKGGRVRLGVSAPLRCPSIAKNCYGRLKQGFQKRLTVSITLFSNHPLISAEVAVRESFSSSPGREHCH